MTNRGDSSRRGPGKGKAVSIDSAEGGRKPTERQREVLPANATNDEYLWRKVNGATPDKR